MKPQIANLTRPKPILIRRKIEFFYYKIIENIQNIENILMEDSMEDSIDEILTNNDYNNIKDEAIIIDYIITLKNKNNNIALIDILYNKLNTKINEDEISDLSSFKKYIYNKKYKYNKTILMLMCEYSKYFYDKIEILLIGGADPTIKDNSGLSSLSYAAKSMSNDDGDERIFSLLHKYNSKYPDIYVGNYKSYNDYSSVCISDTASYRDLLNVIKILTEENKIYGRKIAELESVVSNMSDLTAVVNALVEKVREIDFRPPHCGNAEYEAANSRFDAARNFNTEKK